MGEGDFHVSIIDWAAFTIPIDYTERQPNEPQFRARVVKVTEHLLKIIPTIMQVVVDDLEPTAAQRPYRRAYLCPNTGMRINADIARREALIVFNGGACSTVRKIGAQAMTELLLAVAESGSRLDIATDIETDLGVKAVADAGWNPRMKSTSLIVSSMGETLYIGSRKSTAFARVYRYLPPHPRARLLRVEHELKKEQARAVAGMAAIHGVELAQRSVADKFGYNASLLKKTFAGPVRDIKTERTQRTLARTELWLMTQAAPAFQRLVKQGVIDDPEAWVKRYMLGDI